MPLFWSVGDNFEYCQTTASVINRIKIQAHAIAFLDESDTDKKKFNCFCIESIKNKISTQFKPEFIKANKFWSVQLNNVVH